MNLLDLVNRTTDPAPWSEGDNIPTISPGMILISAGGQLSEVFYGNSR